MVQDACVCDKAKNGNNKINNYEIFRWLDFSLPYYSPFHSCYLVRNLNCACSVRRERLFLLMNSCSCLELDWLNQTHFPCFMLIEPLFVEFLSLHWNKLINKRVYLSNLHEIRTKNVCVWFPPAETEYVDIEYIMPQLPNHWKTCVNREESHFELPHIRHLTPSLSLMLLLSSLCAFPAVQGISIWPMEQKWLFPPNPQAIQLLLRLGIYSVSNKSANQFIALSTEWACECHNARSQTMAFLLHFKHHLRWKFLSYSNADAVNDIDGADYV